MNDSFGGSVIQNICIITSNQTVLVSTYNEKFINYEISFSSRVLLKMELSAKTILELYPKIQRKVKASYIVTYKAF